MAYADDTGIQSLDRLREIASDAQRPLPDRRRSILQIFTRYLSNGMTLGRMASQLGYPAWLRDEDIVLVAFLAGKIPVHWSPEDTIFAMHLLPATDDSPVTVYLRIGGKISRDDVMIVLRGRTHHPALIDRWVVEIGHFPPLAG